MGTFANFIGAVFSGPANFEVIEIAGHALLRRTHFAALANFRRGNFGKTLEFDGAQFQGWANLEGIVVRDSLFCRTDVDGNGSQVVFADEVRLLLAQVGGTSDFRGSIFKGVANFDSACFGRLALFGPDSNGKRVEFWSKAIFRGAEFGGAAEFTGVQFQGLANFAEATFRGLASYSPYHKDKTPHDEDICVEFRDEAIFRLIQVGTDAQFVGARFARKADFTGARIDGTAWFGRQAESQVTIFEDDAYFSSLRVKSRADFRGAHFCKKAHFILAEIDGDAVFAEAFFDGPVSFRNAQTPVVDFTGATVELPPKHATFGGPIDFRGFRYERIQGEWKALLPRQVPDDREPYTRMEAALRATGVDRGADEVYVERRRVERKLKWERKQFGSWFRDCLYGSLANYGVRPYRLALLTAGFLVLGTIIFRAPGAVMQRDPAERSLQPLQLSWKQASGVSFNQFLPVEIPSGNGWIPTEKPIPVDGLGAIAFSTYATFHRLAGLLLVPLGIAALTGLLHRRGRN